jgi:hypothetical protein
MSKVKNMCVAGILNLKKIVRYLGLVALLFYQVFFLYFIHVSKFFSKKIQD